MQTTPNITNWLLIQSKYWHCLGCWLVASVLCPWWGFGQWTGHGSWSPLNLPLWSQSQPDPPYVVGCLALLELDDLGWFSCTGLCCRWAWGLVLSLSSLDLTVPCETLPWAHLLDYVKALAHTIPLSSEHECQSCRQDHWLDHEH